MTSTPEASEKMRAMPIEKRLAMLANIDDMQRLCREKIKLMSQLHDALMREWTEQYLEATHMDWDTYWTDERIARWWNTVEKAKFYDKSDVEIEGQQMLLAWAEQLVTAAIVRHERHNLRPLRYHSVAQYWRSKRKQREREIERENKLTMQP